MTPSSIARRAHFPSRSRYESSARDGTRVLPDKVLTTRFAPRAFAAVVGAAGQIVAAYAGSATNASAPSFADFRLGVSENLIDGNFILRQPSLVGGASYDGFHEAPDVAAFGAFARRSSETSGMGEFIFGGNYVAHAGHEQWEVQTKYVAPSGIGMGAGYVDDPVLENVWFVNAVARGKRGALNFYLSPLVQNGPRGLSPGGYAALYADHLFVGGGGDGDQWRILVAWSANNKKGSALDPSLEVLFVNQNVGPVDGEKFLFVNGSLKRNMGFLSTGSRLGRALGPQGLQFANPVSFLSQPWGRTVDVWETGEILNIRLARRELPDGEVITLAQTVFFPMQALGSESRLRGLFAGVQHVSDPLPSNSFLIGHAGRLGRVSVNVVGSYDIEQSAISGAFGIKIFF